MISEPALLPRPQCCLHPGLPPSPQSLTSIGELSGDSWRYGGSPARGRPGTGPPRRASSGCLRGGRRFPGAARPGRASCPSHFLNHSLISTGGCQGDKHRRGDPLLRLRGHRRGSWWGRGQSGTWAEGAGCAPPRPQPSPGARSLPPPNKAGAASDAQPGWRRGWRRPSGEGECLPGDLATGWHPASCLPLPRACTPGGAKGNPAPLTPRMINFPPPRSVGKEQLLQPPPE